MSDTPKTDVVRERWHEIKDADEPVIVGPETMEELMEVIGSLGGETEESTFCPECLQDWSGATTDPGTCRHCGESTAFPIDDVVCPGLLICPECEEGGACKLCGQLVYEYRPVSTIA